MLFCIIFLYYFAESFFCLILQQPFCGHFEGCLADWESGKLFTRLPIVVGRCDGRHDCHSFSVDFTEAVEGMVWVPRMLKH